MPTEPPNIDQLRESVSRMGPHWVETDPNFEVSWWSIPDRDFQVFADAARFLLSLVGEGGRVVVETPCEHGVVHDDCDQLVCGHELCSDGWYINARPGCWCPGGSRRVVWPEEEA